MAGVDPTSRADYNKAHVIISEKRDKKAAKYLVKDLPYRYTSKAQFERSMDTPIGTEWNTRVGFQRGTLPKVVKKVRFLELSRRYRLLTCIIVDGNRHHSLGKIVVISSISTLLSLAFCNLLSPTAFAMYSSVLPSHVYITLTLYIRIL